MPSIVSLRSGNTSVALSSLGAELQSLKGPDGHEYLWQAGEAWPRHAPILFPAICRHVDDELRVDGREYPLGHHGFARDLNFKVGEMGSDHVTLTLEDSAWTRSQYPFRFRLDVGYRLMDQEVCVSFRVQNNGDRSMPFGIGSHPAFAWPLDSAAAEKAHLLTFENAEPAPVRRTRENLLLPAVMDDTPVAAGEIQLDPVKFSDGAIILDALRSSAVRYGTPGGRAVRLSWTGFRELALWSPGDGAFLCIEPWRGLPAPQGWRGDEHDRTDLEHLAPQEARTYSYRIAIEAPC
ncbi:galactose mutarotase-like enzyme [Paenarthrobacter nicotinovorans]|uniref:aldose 1-epimerase family protein n=1 Tax=Paenarthrobacter nicotinovorans TaxID=29320 RepID=UPI002786C6AF|nr:galactose mutarotase-like enzyme [Paenarthrobacter nicotinovorans]